MLKVNDPANMSQAERLFGYAKDFQIKGDFMFATRESDSVSNNCPYYSLEIMYFIY